MTQLQKDLETIRINHASTNVMVHDDCLVYKLFYPDKNVMKFAVMQSNDIIKYLELNLIAFNDKGVLDTFTIKEKI